MSSSQSGSHRVDLTGLREPGVLDAALPPALRELHPHVHEEEEEPQRYFVVLYTPTGQSYESHAGLQVAALNDPVNEDTAAREADTYPPSVYQQTPVPQEYRARYGQHSFVTTSLDLDSATWALTSDSLYISVTFPKNAVTDAEVWNLADQILRLATPAHRKPHHTRRRNRVASSS